MRTEQELVRNHVLYEQSTVVSRLIKSGDIPDESLFGQWYEVMEWWLVTPYMARLLHDECEIIIEDCGCFWWGRTTAGQAIYMDEVVSVICRGFE